MMPAMIIQFCHPVGVVGGGIRIIVLGLFHPVGGWVGTIMIQGLLHPVGFGRGIIMRLIL